MQLLPALVLANPKWQPPSQPSCLWAKNSSHPLGITQSRCLRTGLGLHPLQGLLTHWGKEKCQVILFKHLEKGLVGSVHQHPAKGIAKATFQAPSVKHTVDLSASLDSELLQLHRHRDHSKSAPHTGDLRQLSCCDWDWKCFQLLRQHLTQ